MAFQPSTCKRTIASRRSDPWLQAALDAGGHLGDEVARALLEDELWTQANQQIDGWALVDTVDEATGELYRSLIRDDEALD